MDYIRFWSTGRTPDQTDRASLVAEYNFNQGTARGDNTTISQAEDSAGNYHATLKGFTLTGANSNFIKGKLSEAELNEIETIQKRLDSGKETPFEIYKELFEELNDRELALRALYGKKYAGGLIFYLDIDNETGKVVTATDATPADSAFDDLYWGGTEDQGLMWDDAKKYCAGLKIGDYEDWFLPSKEELNLIWSNLADSDGDEYNAGPDDPRNAYFNNFCLVSGSSCSTWKNGGMSGNETK